ncbi:3-carboxy-cis,cis-muconate cycloisomerase [Actinomadura parmotrematis]|uniref:3-carboxy-cis,cis-muconate cycloisomerase n=1 Tax=Actinomadura parmotrematis TaxID=2864039 RepID=A0ABS7FPW7_9ACTN|nr:3-carboxy-cis,cis-muconate cycloisomerase [Actinomadura parmotrematis]MBW8482406.1 3-carboxy-cis,cis-muconate cycloisomerase [Actinomadura parmotrematis]
MAPAHSSADGSGLLAPVWAGTRAAVVTGDAAWVRAMLDAEAALARAQARFGTVPDEAARAIGAAAAAIAPDPVVLAEEARDTSNPVLPLVRALKDAVRAVAPDAAQHVHQGATSQDVLDTAAMLVARDARALILDDLAAVASRLADLAREHRDTVMTARTLGQRAVPTTFGLKAATWLTGVRRAARRLADAELPAQLGGAAGTLAALGPPELAALFAGEAGLDRPLVPWHAERTPVAGLGGALAGVTGALGKIATDVVLLAQTEVGEVAEASGGASSAMPHKRNPARAILVRAAALQAPALASVLLAAPLGELERATGAWQAEWAVLRDCLRLAGGAAATGRELLAGLAVDAARMREHAASGDVGAAGALIDDVLAEDL